MVNPTIKFDEWFKMMQQKHHIYMMLFLEKNQLESKNQVEDNLFAAAHVSKEVKETEIEAEAKKEAHKEKNQT